jgi:PLD-like domain
MTTWLVDRDGGAELTDGCRRHGTALRIICPFIKVRPIVELLRTSQPPQFEVVTRFNLADFGSGVSDLAALRVILEAGGRGRGVRSLHAKVFLFGNTRAAVTSANLTSRGLEGNHEFGCVSEDDSFYQRGTQVFRSVVGSRCWIGPNREPTRRMGGAGHSLLGLRRAVRTGGSATRLRSRRRPRSLTPPVVDGWPAESGQAFVKFFGKSDDRLPWTFPAFEEVRRAGCHWACTYPRGKRPRQVADGDTLFTARLVKDPDDVLIFGRAIGMAHVEGRDDATTAKIDARPWKTEWPHYIRVHDGQFIAGPLAHGIRLAN